MAFVQFTAFEIYFNSANQPPHVNHANSELGKHT
jgi:hypothetical protein